MWSILDSGNTNLIATGDEWSSKKGQINRKESIVYLLWGSQELILKHITV